MIRENSLLCSTMKDILDRNVLQTSEFSSKRIGFNPTFSFCEICGRYIRSQLQDDKDYFIITYFLGLELNVIVERIANSNL